jgi:hypothetical protein
MECGYSVSDLCYTWWVVGGMGLRKLPHMLYGGSGATVLALFDDVFRDPVS